MHWYAPLLERTRVPQPSLQKYAVISIFEKLRSSPPHLDPDSDPGRDAITYCLNSVSPAVVDQSVRELCRLVKDSKMDISRGLLELQSALEASDPRFVTLFVKALGFLVKLGFQKSPSSFRFSSSDTHPYVKILSCRAEVQTELVQQVVIFMVQNKHLGMVEVCEFLRPFLNYLTIWMPVSAAFPSFMRNLVSSMASLCCSFPREAIPVIKLLMGCVKYFPGRDAEELVVLFHVVECTLDSYVVVLRQLAGMRLLVREVQLCGMELLEAIFSLPNDLLMHSGGVENILERARHLLVVQKEIGFSFEPGFSAVILSLFIPLIQSKVEHEQLAVMKILLFLLEWKNECGRNICGAANELNEELLFIFPVMNIVSSPCKLVKQEAVAILSFLEKMLIDLFFSSKKGQSIGKFPAISKLECILYRFLLHFWFQDQSSLSGSFYLSYAPTESCIEENGHNRPKPWTSLLRGYSLQILGKMKSSLPLSQNEEVFMGEISVMISTVASVFLMHQELGNSSVDLLAVIGNMKPELGITLLLVILFYNHAFSVKEKEIDFHGMLLKLVAMIPSLASHPAMAPLIIQTVLPMLRKDAKPVLYATGIRLICKTWETSDRVFGSLQGVLLPVKFDEFSSSQEICISMAASVRDVCRRNPDRGVDLVLSVEACIENEVPLVHSLGLQSLAHLCEADVIDFYTAWDVIAKDVLDYRTNAVLAYSLCLLLRWGALDAEVYAEAASNILKILWEVGTSRPTDHSPLWAKARASAFLALSQFEVEHIMRSIPNFKDMNMELLISETDAEVLGAIEGFEARVMNYEHINRRRLVKQKRVPRNKIEKLLDIFPQIMFPRGNRNRIRELPGAALFCLSVAPVDMNKGGVSKGIEEVNVEFEDAFVEIASCLKLSRNILIALISFQSWKPFMRRWMKVQLMLLDAKAHSSTLDKTSKAATYILKIMSQIAEECIPSCAENCALAIGAFCLVLPLTAHAVKSAASKFLLGWVFQYEHEYRQWSAAISLGLISSCLHVTDHKQKHENINALLEVAFKSKSTLVKGACGVGLGLLCQDLLRRVDSDGKSSLEKVTFKVLEVELLRKIIGALSLMVYQFTQSSPDILKLPSCIPNGRDDNSDQVTSIDLVHEKSGDMEEDIWGVTGLVLGLASSVSALYRTGAHDAVRIIKDWLFSHIPCINPSIKKLDISDRHEMMLSASSCLALPIIVAFCQRMELIEDTEIHHLVNGCVELISELVAVENSDTFHQSLLMLSCMGSGSLLSSILNGGLHFLKVDTVKSMLALLKKCYSTPHPAFVHLGGMLGVVNALGADAGFFVQCVTSTKPDITSSQKESSYVMGQLLSNPVVELELTSLVQDIFLVAQNSDDHQLREFAAWALSFLRHSLWFRPLENEENASEKDVVGSKSLSQRLPENSMVFKLSLWLMHLNLEAGTTSHINTVTSALRCLSHASRLPTFDWGAIIRRCMRYEDQVAKLLAADSSIKKGVLREECLIFSIHFGNQFDSLLSFLDELSDLSRFQILELNLQSCIFLNLADLMKIFSNSRIVKLFDDISNFFSLLASSDCHTSEERSLLRVSCWKGLCLCLDTFSLDLQDYVSNMENCMELLFHLLPRGGTCQDISLEWSEAVRCLGKARQGWLLGFLQASEVNFGEENIHVFEIVKKIKAKARLVRIGSIPFNELGKLKAYMLNSRPEVVWNVLTEVAATLQHADESVKREWLLDTVQISCVTSYPSTALQFLGLLCGNCCKYMPLLVADRNTVLSDLSVTLTSLLLDRSWEGVVEPVVSCLWTLTERIYEWTRSLLHGDKISSNQSIDSSENDKAVFLLQVIHNACVYLKDHLPREKQLRLANMLVP